MLTIIDYGNTEAQLVTDTLKKLNVEFIISSKEADFLSGDKLILPDSDDITSSIKNLHLLNLFSILRMIKKPILGIGTGMHLMCESLKDNESACLGCFPVECESGEQRTVKESVMLSIIIIKSSNLLKGIGEKDKFYFERKCFIPPNDFTTSIVNMDGKITSSLEKDCLYGVHFNPEKSGEAGLKILNNFLEL